VTDGPFAETKEFIAGFDVLECADLDEAIEVAAKHPSSWFQKIEIRPFMDGLELDGAAARFAAGDDLAGTPYCLMMCLDGIPAEHQVEESIMGEGIAWWQDLKARGLGVFGHPRGRRPVLRAHLRRILAGVAAAIVEGDCDIDSALGRLVDDVELQGIEQRP